MYMNQDCLVSVIIPVYNEKSYIKESLDSIIHQQYQNLEIITNNSHTQNGIRSLKTQ